MDRKGQLRNVAFGGAWSEQIAGNEALAAAMGTIDQAVYRTLNEDLRCVPDVESALGLLCVAHPKGVGLAEAWHRALAIPNAGLRRREITRIAALIRAGLGDRLR